MQLKKVKVQQWKIQMAKKRLLELLLVKVQQQQYQQCFIQKLKKIPYGNKSKK